MPSYGPIEVAWQNALLPWIVLASVFYCGVLFGVRKSAREGRLEAGPFVMTLRTQLWPLLLAAAALGLAVLGFVIWKAYGYSRWPAPGQTLAKALWIGLIPVVSVLASSSAALLLFVPADTSASLAGSAGVATTESGHKALESAAQTGPGCVRCHGATGWNETAGRFQCASCKLYQPSGPRGTA